MRADLENAFADNLSTLGCSVLADDLRKTFSETHVPDNEILNVLNGAASIEIDRRRTLKAQTLLKQAGLLHSYANLDILDRTIERNLDNVLIERLSSCGFVKECANIIIVGAAGTGKTFLAKALAVKACNEGIRTRIVNFKATLSELASLSNKDIVAYTKKLKMLSRVPLLVIDEWYTTSPTRDEQTCLLDLIDARYDRRSTIICTQIPVQNWPSASPNKAIGESIRGRVKAHSYMFELDGPDLRERFYHRP